MTENARKIFDMLGVEPNEIFKVDGCDKYYIDSNLEIYRISFKPYTIVNCPKTLIEIINNPKRITKIKKLKDLAPEEWDKWKDKNCPYNSCGKCIFKYTSCILSRDKDSWINNKDLYSDKFLNQEIEVEK